MNRRVVVLGVNQFQNDLAFEDIKSFTLIPVGVHTKRVTGIDMEYLTTVVVILVVSKDYFVAPIFLYYLGDADSIFELKVCDFC